MTSDLPARTAVYLVTPVAWLLLAVSLFLERANAFAYVSEAGRLLDYAPTGAIIIALLVLLVPSTLLSMRGSFAAGVVTVLLWFAALALSAWAAFHLGTHYAYLDVESDSPGAGTFMSLIAAATGFVCACLVSPRRSGSKVEPFNQNSSNE